MASIDKVNASAVSICGLFSKGPPSTSS